MKRFLAMAMFCGSAMVLAGAQQQAPPPWTYTVNPPPIPGATPPPVDPAPKQVPGSPVSLTTAQTRDAFNPPDWHPADHPAMPDAVAHGRRPDMRACGFCHLVNGQGRPENAALAGLPAAYIIQQMADFKNGDRKSAEPKMGPPAAMIQDAKAANDDEIKAAAAYFSSFAFRKWIRVVEAKDVPKSRIAGSMHVPTNDGNEPLGSQRRQEYEPRPVPKGSLSGRYPETPQPVGNPRLGTSLSTVDGRLKDSIIAGTCDLGNNSNFFVRRLPQPY